MSYRAPKPGEVLEELRAYLRGEQEEPEPQPQRYIFRGTKEVIGGVTVIVGLVEPDDDRGA